MSSYGTCNEFSKLRAVITCPPTHFEIRKPINIIQAKYHERGQGPDPVKRVHQYEAFKKALILEGINVWEISPSEKYTYQVFTRDTGVVTNHGAIIANLKFDLRKGEEKVVVKELKNRGIAVSEPFEDPAVLEGGDFLFLDNKNVLLGIGDRTNTDALAALKALQPAINFHPVFLPKDFLHLDVVLNIVSQNIALAYAPACPAPILSLLESCGFGIIDVSNEEQETMATNALAIGNNKVIAAACNKQTNEKMKKEGLEVIEIEMSELLKGGGGPRCMTLPVHRSE